MPTICELLFSLFLYTKRMNVRNILSGKEQTSQLNRVYHIVDWWTHITD